ncbi:MAG: L-threonylcarbamoyladenylate synthase [Candidatus Nomurabacteria bacterium]|nr:L-threonylcarbamoyladenylate synthase [Candidatus Nomurabacteria bacterium]
MEYILKGVIKSLKKDGIGIIPTDTLYGIVGSAFSKKAVEKIYKIKGRDENKPFIVLISSIKDLEKFGIQHPYKLEFVRMLEKFWPGKVSVILSCSKYKYLHRGENAIAFRLPNKKSLIELIKKTGPLVAPSANPQGMIPASNIKEAKKYFGDNVDFYVAGGTLKSKPSTLIKINKNGEIEVLRGKLKSNGNKK